MLSSPPTLAPTPAALPPAAPPAAQPAGSAGGPSFAQFLTDQVAPPPAAEEAAEPAPSPASQTATRRASGQPARPAQPRTPDAPAGPNAQAAADTSASTAAAEPALETEDAPDTPELKEFTQLIGMAQPQPDTAAANLAPKPAGTDASRGRPAAARDDALQDRSALQAVTGEAAPPRHAGLRADKATANSTADTQQASTQPAAGEQPTALPAATAPSFAAALAQALPPPTALPTHTAPATGHAGVQAPLHSPAFAPELGARVSLLAVDGVQRAELQLNPADMGPVSVQIVVDGGQAQVSFHALQAETRQALEQSLPDLAAALQGQGLTLSGGGVFQQAPRDAEPGDTAPDADRRPGRAGAGREGASDSAGVAPVATRRTVGLLDAFA